MAAVLATRSMRSRTAPTPAGLGEVECLLQRDPRTRAVGVGEFGLTLTEQGVGREESGRLGRGSGLDRPAPRRRVGARHVGAAAVVDRGELCVEQHRPERVRRPEGEALEQRAVRGLGRVDLIGDRRAAPRRDARAPRRSPGRRPR